MDDAIALEKAEGRDCGVEIQAGRESGAERETERLQLVHNLHVSSAGRIPKGVTFCVYGAMFCLIPARRK